MRITWTLCIRLNSHTDRNNNMTCTVGYFFVNNQKMQETVVVHLPHTLTTLITSPNDFLLYFHSKLLKILVQNFQESVKNISDQF